MNIDANVHVNIHYDRSEAAVVASVLRGFVAILERIVKKMATTKEEILAEITVLTKDVTDNGTVGGSAVTLIQGLNARIADLLAQIAAGSVNLDDVKTQLEALHAAIQANTNTLAAGVAAGTPADTGTPAPPQG